MATDGGFAPGSVAHELFRAPQGFDFFQAVRVLQALRPDGAPAASGAEPAAEPVRFRSQVSLGFPPADMVSVRPGQDGGPPTLTVAFMGLAGAQGPLPRPFTEEVMHQARAGDTSALDFLDLFNHRLVGLMYRARARHTPALEAHAAPVEGEPPALGDRSWVARYLFALMGLGTPGLDGTGRAAAALQVPRRALLGYAALLSTETRSAVGLERILSEHFGVTARVVPFTGGWVRLHESDWTRIGPGGQNRALGRDAVLGRRVWDAQGAFTVQVGPLALGEYVRFLPDGAAFRALCSLAHFYAGIDLEFTVSLVLKADEVPPSRLGTRAGSRLGWTSWLRTRPYGPRDAEVRLDPARWADSASPAPQSKD